MGFLERIKALRDNLEREGSEAVESIEYAFPEIKDVKPFVRAGSLFFKEQYPKSVYCLQYDSGEFKIMNISDGKFWKGRQPPSNVNQVNYRKEVFLTKRDFRKLLKFSGGGLNKVKIIPQSSLKNLHYEIFK